MFPSLMIRNASCAALYRRKINCVCASFMRKNKEKKYEEFNEILKNNNASDKEKRKMRMQYKLLWHLTGMDPEEYCTIGGLKYSTFRTKLNNVSRWRQNVFQYSVNKAECRKYVDDKAVFNELFADMLHRKWILSNDDQLEQFCKKYDEVLVKPLDGSSGRGIHVIRIKEMSDAETVKVIGQLSQENVLIEEVLKQRGVLHDINPTSVNTMRINTLLDNGRVVFLNAFFRTGREGQVTDNLHAGGVFWHVDSETGKIRYGVMVDGNYALVHPDSGIKMAGMQIPHFFEAVELCKRAQLRIPEVPQVGWDVVISDDFIALIEGNSGSGIWDAEHDRNLWKVMKHYLYRNQIDITTRF